MERIQSKPTVMTTDTAGHSGAGDEAAALRRAHAFRFEKGPDGNVFRTLLAMSAELERLREVVSVEDACKPWEYCVGEPPDYESPLQCIWQACIGWCQELVAKSYKIKEYDSDGATESLDGDAMVGFYNIIEQIAENEVREASAWRPIETAPRDGTRMLLVKAGYRATCGNFNKIHQMWATNYAEDYEDNEEFVRLIQDASYRPTHWQPLPTSPAKAAQGGGE